MTIRLMLKCSSEESESKDERIHMQNEDFAQSNHRIIWNSHYKKN